MPPTPGTTRKSRPISSARTCKSFLKEVESFATGEYAAALAKGDDLPAAERKAVIDKLVRYTGIDAHYIDESNLRCDVSALRAPTAARPAARPSAATMGG